MKTTRSRSPALQRQQEFKGRFEGGPVHHFVISAIVSGAMLALVKLIQLLTGFKESP
jgi:hypothetical protein